MNEPIRYHMVSLGCCKNLVDAENMLGVLNGAGFCLTPEPSEADVIIINTCAFIDSAKQESIDSILEHAAFKESGRCRLLAVTGCLAERYRAEIAAELPEVDLVLGVSEYGKIAAATAEKLSLSPHLSVPTSPADYHSRVVTTPFYTAYLKIAEGCDNHCTYCAIPNIRGRYQSRQIDELVQEAQLLADGGVRELIVVAQDTTRYGLDLYQKPMLPELLRRLCDIEGIDWIRLHYTYPEMISDELIDTIADHDKILHYLDIPVQHSEDSILKRMGRKSRKNELLALFEKLRCRLPDVVLRTSLIVGFPGETQQDFENLCEFIHQIRFDRLGVFPYSQEEGTPAALLPDQLPEQVKQDRYDTIMTLQQQISLERNCEKRGRVLRCLVEAYDTVSDRYIARTYGDSIEIDNNIFFTADYRLESGDFADVLVADADEYALYGKAQTLE